MLVTNGDVLRTLDNQRLAEIFCTIIEKTARKRNIRKRLDKKTREWYNENVVKGVKEWLDEPYYDAEYNVYERED